MNGAIEATVKAAAKAGRKPALHLGLGELGKVAKGLAKRRGVRDAA